MKTTQRVVSHFGPPAIHTAALTYRQLRQRLAVPVAQAPVAQWRLVPWRERPPSPRAWYGLGGAVEMHTSPLALQGSLPNQRSVPEGHWSAAMDAS